VLVVSHDRDFLDRVATSILMAEEDGGFIEYAGGYSDMLAQRGEGVAARQVAKPAAAKEAAPRERASRPRKLTFSQQHALKTLPGEIATLEKTIAALQAKLTDANFYARDHKGFLTTSDELARAQTTLADHEHRWLELEMLREETEGA
jgi:ATP-binding cassette subfamily F protein uup